jgi:hypothetical protein
MGLFFLGMDVADKGSAGDDAPLGDLGLFDEENGAGACDSLFRRSIATNAVWQCSTPVVAEAPCPFGFVWAAEAFFEGALIAGIEGGGCERSDMVPFICVVGELGVGSVAASMGGCLGERASDVLGFFSGPATAGASWGTVREGAIGWGWIFGCCRLGLGRRCWDEHPPRWCRGQFDRRGL